MNWDFIYQGETRDLDDAVRATSGGSFLQLPEGCTHYEFIGPEVADVTVLIHGFSVPYFIWDSTLESLTSAGLRVLRYDLFGRGFSDRPHVGYNMQLFVDQLESLLAALHLAQVNLVGLSMGGAIAAAFTVQFPSQVRRLALIDPVGTEPMPLSRFYKAALLPGVSELLLSLLGTEKMVQNLAADFFDPEEVERFRAQYRVQMQFRGFKRAIISTLRNKAVDGSPETYAQLGKLTIPVLLFWGRQDRTLPIEQSALILRLIPRAEFHVIENSGHIPNCERPEVVHPILLEFLNRT